MAFDTFIRVIIEGDRKRGWERSKGPCIDLKLRRRRLWLASWPLVHVGTRLLSIVYQKSCACVHAFPSIRMQYFVTFLQLTSTAWQPDVQNHKPLETWTLSMCVNLLLVISQLLFFVFSFIPKTLWHIQYQHWCHNEVQSNGAKQASGAHHQARLNTDRYLQSDEINHNEILVLALIQSVQTANPGVTSWITFPYCTYNVVFKTKSTSRYN